MLNSEHLSLVNKIGDKTEFTITRVHCSTSRKGSLNVHFSCVHEGKKSFVCTFCDYRCKTNGRLKYHIKSVHEKKNLCLSNVMSL